MNTKTFIAIGACIALSGCSAIDIHPGAQNVVLAHAQPASNCRYLGAAVGSQGNWFTGGITTNTNIMIGARNDLRNKAIAMGGDYVWIQNVSNTHTEAASGTSNTTVFGNVYSCSGHPVTMQRAEADPHASNYQPGQPEPRATSTNFTAQVLAAQHVATAQGCGEIRNYGHAEYAASCSAGTLIIRCTNDSCQPVQMKR